MLYRKGFCSTCGRTVNKFSLHTSEIDRLNCRIVKMENEITYSKRSIRFYRERIKCDQNLLRRLENAN
jgi:peroxiredoxin